MRNFLFMSDFICSYWSLTNIAGDPTVVCLVFISNTWRLGLVYTINSGIWVLQSVLWSVKTALFPLLGSQSLKNSKEVICTITYENSYLHYLCKMIVDTDYCRNYSWIKKPEKLLCNSCEHIFISEVSEGRTAKLNDHDQLWSVLASALSSHQ